MTMRSPEYPHEIPKREWSPGDTAHFLPLLIERDDKKCHYCGNEVFLNSEIEKNPKSARERQLAVARSERRATVDHKVPVSKGGSEFDIENMVIACSSCNEQKRDRFAQSFLKNKKHK